MPVSLPRRLVEVPAPWRYAPLRDTKRQLRLSAVSWPGSSRSRGSR